MTSIVVYKFGWKYIKQTERKKVKYLNRSWEVRLVSAQCNGYNPTRFGLEIWRERNPNPLIWFWSYLVKAVEHTGFCWVVCSDWILYLLIPQASATLSFKKSHFKSEIIKLKTVTIDHELKKSAVKIFNYLKTVKGKWTLNMG